MKIKSLGLKVSLIVALMIAVIIAAILYIINVQSSSLVSDLTAKEAAAANVSFVKQMEGFQKDSANIAKIIANTNDIIDAILNKNDEALKQTLMNYSADMDMVTVCDTDGNVLTRMHNDQKGDNIMAQAIVSSALKNGEVMYTIVKDADAGLITQGSAPIKDFSGSIIGAVICSHDLSNPVYVEEIKSFTGSEATIFHGDTRLMTTITDEKGDRVIGTKASDAVIDTVINQKKNFDVQINLFGHDYHAFYSPLIVGGEVVGMLFNGVNIDETLAEQKAMMTFVLVLGIILGVVSLLMVFVYSIIAVSRPLKKIGAFAEKIKSGDLGISSSSASTINVRSSDEVGVMARVLEQAYMQLKGYVGEIKDRMEGLAGGDLATESTYQFQGDFTLIGNSINLIINNLHNTVSEINSSTIQVSTGSKHVADGAQSLAQGSTQQAAAVQQLSSSIAEIAQKTKENAEMANRAAKLAETIKGNAEKGSRQMEEMTVAVKDINQASQSIQKVIKVIDDIAFQTNILALNAAVEAARAGQHGKGFAVVAEEVRNLAAKSAEAAKDTGSLIVNSMEKAELGTRIAEENAASLTEIVNGIDESDKIVHEIALLSEEQSAGITQINTGIDQVAQVVQQNSATAEESAAASEEMSGQSAMLENLISQFKLKNSGASRSLSSGPKAASAQLATPEDTVYTPNENEGFGKY